MSFMSLQVGLMLSMRSHIFWMHFEVQYSIDNCCSETKIPKYTKFAQNAPTPICYSSLASDVVEVNILFKYDNFFPITSIYLTFGHK